MEAAATADTGAVRIVSRRMVRPSNDESPPPTHDIHLTPWDLRLLAINYIQKGIILPKPPTGGESLVDSLACSLARALGRYYHFAGRLAVKEHEHDPAVTVALRCTGQGAELIHATAPGVSAVDIIGTLYSPSSLPPAWAFFPLNGALSADAAMGPEPLPVLSAQVTELAGGGVFVGMSMNHAVADGTTFWELFNTWSEIHRGRGGETSRTAPAHERWFVDTSSVPIPLPLGKLQEMARRRYELPPVREAFFTFSAASVKRLKARANDEMSMATATATATISALQALLAHLWRAVCRTRRLPAGQETSYVVICGCRGRIHGIPPGYVGNAVFPSVARCAAGEVSGNGLGWAAWQLNRAVASFDEAAMKEFLGRWPLEPAFPFIGNLAGGGTGLATGSSPRFDVFGNDFGWGKPLAVRSGAGHKTDGKATVFEGPDRGGSVSLEVCLAPDALERLVADREFMAAVTLPRPPPAGGAI